MKIFVAIAIFFYSISALGQDSCNNNIDSCSFLSKVKFYYPIVSSDSVYHHLTLNEKIDIVRVLNTLDITTSTYASEFYSDFFKKVVHSAIFWKIVEDLELVVESGANYRRYKSVKYNIVYGGPLNCNSYYKLQ